MTSCGHTARTFDGAPLICDLPVGHDGYHEQRTKLRDRTERTNWGHDGKAPWASSADTYRQRKPGKAAEKGIG